MCNEMKKIDVKQTKSFIQSAFNDKNDKSVSLVHVIAVKVNYIHRQS